MRRQLTDWARRLWSGIRSRSGAATDVELQPGETIQADITPSLWCFPRLSGLIFLGVYAIMRAGGRLLGGTIRPIGELVVVSILTAIFLWIARRLADQERLLVTNYRVIHTKPARRWDESYSHRALPIDEITTIETGVNGRLRRALASVPIVGRRYSYVTFYTSGGASLTMDWVREGDLAITNRIRQLAAEDRTAADRRDEVYVESSVENTTFPAE